MVEALARAVQEITSEHVELAGVDESCMGENASEP